MAESTTSADQPRIELPINWDTPPDLPTKFATNLIVQRTPEAFIISFFEIRPPILIGTPDQDQGTVSKMKEIVGQCVARIIVTPDRMKDFVGVFHTSYEAWKNDKEPGS